VRVCELADWLDATFEGDGERNITGAAPIEAAGVEDLSFAGTRKAYEQADASAAGCLIVPIDFPNPRSRTVIRSPQPRAAFARAIGRLYPKSAAHPGVHPSAVIHPTANVHPTCSIGPHVSIGPNTEVGQGTSVGPGCSLAANVLIGADCWLHPRVTIYDDSSIGDRCILHSGCVIGADGFGFVMAGDHYEKFPQIGRVVLGDDVEIGANATVDRAALGVTQIGDGTKLDNMVHIGHNCRIGKHVVIAAQTGFSGGVEVGDYAVVGGQVGVGDKARIEARAIIGSGAGILTSKIVRGGQVVWGTPARPLQEHLRSLANIGKLDTMRSQIAELKDRLTEIEALIAPPASPQQGS
jgi:UDP-3-O-[3-hydroxymyristoyl] glucosamine N-acyltransferase